MLGTDCQEDAEGGRFDNRHKGLKVVNALLLAKTLGYEASLVPCHLTTQTTFLLKYKAAANDISDHW
jgi:hypothetical protein